MVNPFFKYGGLEFFGTFEYATGKRDADVDSRSFTQLAADLSTDLVKTKTSMWPDVITPSVVRKQFPIETLISIDFN